MNEEKEKNELNPNELNPKEDTIDILVQPKKKEGNEESLRSDAPAPKAEKKEKESENRASEALHRVPKEKKTVREEADRTRPVARSERPRPSSAREKTQETRIGSSLSVPRVEPKKTPPRPVKTKSARDMAKYHKESPGYWKGVIKDWLGSISTTLIRTVIYVAFVLVVSATLSYYGIRCANDVFALVKEEVVATVSIPENATVSEVAELLSEKGIIEYPSVFRIYIGYKNRDTELVFKAGDYELKSTLNYDQLVSMMKDRKTRTIVTLTIPEGYTVDEIIEFFTSRGMGTREGFVEAINHYDYEYEFVNKLEELSLSPHRKYRLEGYLFPDTYDFYTDSSEVAIIDKMLANFDYRFEKDYFARLDEMGWTLDQVITLASIVQMEGKFTSDFYTISGVFHNRLTSRDLKKLESDATIQYFLEERKENISYEDLAVDNAYNTYMYPGLTPSAIANPGWEAIMAALYPEKHTYYYFVADTDGSTIFAKTHPEHLKNVAAVAQAKANGGSVD